MPRPSKDVKEKLYEVIGEDGSIYLSRTSCYLKKGQVIALTPQEAELLIAGRLIQPAKEATESELEKTIVLDEEK